MRTTRPPDSPRIGSSPKQLVASMAGVDRHAKRRQRVGDRINDRCWGANGTTAHSLNPPGLVSAAVSRWSYSISAPSAAVGIK